MSRYRIAITLAGVASIYLISSRDGVAATLENVAVTASSGLVQSFNRGPWHLIDESGLTGSAHGTVPDHTMWLSTGTGCCGGFPATDPIPSVTFDLGGVHSINNMRVWNYNESIVSRGTAAADIEVAGEDFAFVTLSPAHAFTIAPGTDSDFSQVIDFGGLSARYVRLAGMTSHGGDNGFVGLSEVQFDGTPEPGLQLPYTATVHSVSSNIAGGFNRHGGTTVNEAGWFRDTHSIRPNGTMWLNQGTFGGDPLIHDLNPFIVWDLGSVVPVAQMKFWNYNEFLPGRDDLLDRGIRLADISVAGEDLVFTKLIDQQSFNQATGDETVDYSQLISIGTSARYIKFDRMSNFGNLENFVGISEVQFFAVPEPATYVWGLVIGLAALGARWRRRRG